MTWTGWGAATTATASTAPTPRVIEMAGKRNGKGPDRDPSKTPLTEEMVPLIISEDDPWQPAVPTSEVHPVVNSDPIPVMVDGHAATCCMGDFGTHSRRLWISFDPHHPRWGEGFRTKYYRFVEPGKLELRTGELVDIYKIE